MLGLATPHPRKKGSPAHRQRHIYIAPLRNTPNDLRKMESALRAVGFQMQTVLNANQNPMKHAVRDFGRSAQGADVAFCY